MKDYILLLDENEKLKRIINAYEFYDDEIKSTTAGERVLTFKMNDSVVGIENGNKIGVFVEGKFDLFIVDQVEAETYYSTSIKVTCLHDFYSIQTQKAITQYYRKSVSLRDAMTEMLKGTSYELGECVERALISIGPYLYKNPLWCIQDIISNFGVEIDYSIELNETRTGIAKKLVHVVNALGADTGIRCSTDLNVSKIKRIQKDKFYTVMYGCGAEYQKDLVKYKYDFKNVSWSTSNGNPTDKPAGQEFVEDKKAIAKYGRIIGIFEDGRIKDPELLLKKTWEALQKNNRPIVSYELDIEELKTEDGYEHLNFKLGDIIILQNTIDNSRAKFRIVEDCVSVRNKNKRKVTVGEQLKGIFSGGNSGNSNGTEGPGGNVVDPGGEEITPPSIEEITPDTLPEVPVVTAKGLWKTVQLSWTYKNKMYYDYEVYASRIKDFEPTIFHMIYSGKASAFLHEAGANETWYYRVRAVNTFGSTTEFSEQVEAHTTKVSDGTQYFESAAIKDALIEELRLDRGWIGTLRGHYIDAKELSVTDGNDKRTLYIDSFGRVHLNVTTLKISSTNVATTPMLDDKANKESLITEINVAPGSVKIKSNKLDIEGATTVGDGKGNYVRVDKYNYLAYVNNKQAMYWGGWLEGSAFVPTMYMGANGFNANSGNLDGSYFAMKNYGNRHHIGFRCRSAGKWSIIEFDENGDVQFSAVRKSVFNTDVYFNNAIHMQGSNLDLRNDNGDIGVRLNYQGIITNQISNLSGGTININGSLRCMYSSNSIGSPDGRFKTAYLVSAPDISSDITLKENIIYTDGKSIIPKLRNDTEEILTYTDMYNYYKDIYRNAEYNYIGQDKRVIGIIANEIKDTKVGNKIINENNSGDLSYCQESRISVLEGALKEAINQIEYWKNKYIDLESKVDFIMEKLK